MRSRRAAIPFLTLGIGLIVVGLAGNRTFLFSGIPFLVIGLAFLIRTRR